MYFGKLPFHAEFVRANMPVQDVTLLDEWTQQGLQLLSDLPEWKAVFDQGPLVHLLFQRSGAKYGLIGSWLPSRDQTQRRYPFLACAPVELPVLNSMWWRWPQAAALFHARLADQLRRAQTAEQPSLILAELDSPPLLLEPDDGLPVWHRWLDMWNVDMLDDALSGRWPQFRTARSVTALLLLLQMSLEGSGQRLLRLPLGDTPELARQLALFWLALCRMVVPGLGRMALMWVEYPAGAELHLSTGGLAPRSWLAQGCPDESWPHVVTMRDLDWLDGLLAGQERLSKLQKYLDYPDMTMRKVLEAVRITATGR